MLKNKKERKQNVKKKQQIDHLWKYNALIVNSKFFRVHFHFRASARRLKRWRHISRSRNVRDKEEDQHCSTRSINLKKRTRCQPWKQRISNWIRYEPRLFIFHKKNIHDGQSKSLLCLPATSVDGVVLCALHLLTRSYQSTKVPHVYIVSSSLQSHSEYFFNVYIQRKEKKN